MHVHVVSREGEVKFWLEPELQLANIYRYNRQQLKEKSSHLLRNTIMSLSAHGNAASAVEVTNISAHGIWLLAHDQELFMPYDEFPWFKDQPVKVIMNVEEQSPGHFYWPDIDVDLTKEIIEHPERFLNKAKST